MSGQTRGFGRYLEDFDSGEVYRHRPGKTIMESDNNLFCLLTMNHHPLHLDQEYARASQQGRIVVAGTLVFSLTVGLTVADVSGRAIANLAYQEVEHLLPVHVGDTLHAETEVLEVLPSRTRPDRGTVKVRSRAINQEGHPVLSFTRTVLVPRRPADPEEEG